VLRRFASEAWRRADAGELADEELYACDAQWAALRPDAHARTMKPPAVSKSPPTTADRAMADVFTPAKRSAVMALIHGSGNMDTELRMVALFARTASPAGGATHAFSANPISSSARACRRVCGRLLLAWLPETEACAAAGNAREWWAVKLARNRARDLVVTRTLRKAGWRVVRIWECDLTPNIGGASLGASCAYWRAIACAFRGSCPVSPGLKLISTRVLRPIVLGAAVICDPPWRLRAALFPPGRHRHEAHG